MSVPQAQLIEDVTHILGDSGWKVTSVPRSGAVDLVAHPEDTGIEDCQPLLTKVISQLASVRVQHTAEMKLLARLLQATPLLIAQYYKSNQTVLHPDTVYNRHSINAINVKTLENLLRRGISPHKIASRGTKTAVRIDHERLTTLLKQTGRTQNQISQELDISRQSLISYQSGNSKPSEETFNKIVELLERWLGISSASDELKNPQPLLQHYLTDQNDQEFMLEQRNLHGLHLEVDNVLERLELQRYWFHHLPWDGVSQVIKNRRGERDITLFTGVGDQSRQRDLSKRIVATKEILEFLNKQGLWVTEDESVKGEITDRLRHVSPMSPDPLWIMTIDDLENLKNLDDLRTKLERGQ